jgi:hypothetical protein
MASMWSRVRIDVIAAEAYVVHTPEAVRWTPFGPLPQLSSDVMS